MQPNWYVDFALCGNEQTDISLPVVANTVFRVLHGAFRTLGTQLALALPQKRSDRPIRHVGDTIRVFSEKREHLDQLVESVSGHHHIRDYCRILYPRAVPEDYSGPWVSYRRYRTSNRNAGRHDNDQLNARRTAAAAERGLPYFKVWSRSGQRYFSLFIEVVKLQAPPSCSAEPDSYGLCVSTRPFAVPDIPAV